MPVRSFFRLFASMKNLFRDTMCFHEICWSSLHWSVEKIQLLFFWINVLFVRGRFLCLLYVILAGAEYYYLRDVL